MTRTAFSAVAAVPLAKLLLDTKNARIRAGHDQPDCIERLLRKPKQMLALAKDIATNGLSTAPILVETLRTKQYVVWDGNRRVTALKLLNNPSLAGNKALESQFAAVAKKAAVTIPSKIDVLASTDKKALLKEVLSRHAGALEGAGQLTWDALLRTMFLLGHKATTDYRLAGLLLMWAEDNEIEVGDQFPITTIHRFLNKERLERLGFRDTGDVVEPTIDADDAVRIAERIVQDFGPGGSMGVNEVFDDISQDKYVESVLVDLGLVRPSKPSSTSTGSGKPSKGTRHTSADGATDEPRPKRPRGSSYRTTHKPDYDRKSVVRTRFKPEFPDGMWKPEEVLRELRRLETKHYPLSAAALFRSFFELSTRAYLKRHRMGFANEMHKNALAAALHMRQHGRLDQGELEAANRRFKEKSQAEQLLQYATLNDYLHSFKAMPDRQSLHVLWSEVEPYLEACWDDARRPQ